MSDPGLPTRAEIAKLPRWAVVAFAAWCARQAILSLKAQWPDAPEDLIRDVTKAVECAEEAPTQGVAGAAKMREIGHQAIMAGLMCCSSQPLFTPKRNLASCAARCAFCAAFAASAVLQADITEAANWAFEAADSAYRPEGTEEAKSVIKSIRTEFDLLASTAASEGWTDSTRVACTSHSEWSEVSPTTDLVKAGLALATLPALAPPEGILEALAKARMKAAADWKARSELAASLPYRYDARCRAETVSLLALMAGGLAGALGMALTGTVGSIALSVVAYLVVALLVDSLLRRAAS